MTLQIRTNVFHCLANGKVVLLDLEADRYIALPDSAQPAFLKCIEKMPLTTDDVTNLRALQKAGLLVEGRGTSAAPDRPAAPLHSTLHSPLPKPSLLALVNVWRAQRRATHALDRNGLCTTIKRVERRKRAAIKTYGGANNGIPRKAVSGFLRLRRYVKTDDQCLRRSLGLIEYLAATGFYPDLVIGVRMKPFEAHAWVQWHDTVLNDTVDQVSRYTPILTV